MKMMLTSRVLTALVMSVWVGIADAYPTGAPLAACQAMIPQGHLVNGVTAQNDMTNSAPYYINVTPRSYCGPNTPVTVELVGAPYGMDFKGFLCQPRPNVDNYVTVGTFSTPAGTQNNCGNNAAITHMNNSTKKSIEFTWTPDSSKQNVYIVCTMVQNYTTFWVKQSVWLQYAGDSRCINPGEMSQNNDVVCSQTVHWSDTTSVCPHSMTPEQLLPTSCANDQTCDEAVSMARCDLGTCKCPSDMKIAHPKDTYCSSKILGDECSLHSDCAMISDTMCDSTCKCQPGFKYNTTSGPCFPKVLHDACDSDNECRFANHSMCIDSSCQCPRAGYIEIGNATHKNCSRTSLPITCSTDQDCNNVVSMSVCKTDGQLKYCECPSHLVLRNETDTKCSDRTTVPPTTPVPTACSTNEECDQAIEMSTCVQGVCKCPPDMKIASATATSCSMKMLHDLCAGDNDCRHANNSKCMNTMCKCPPGFIENAAHMDCSETSLPTGCSTNQDCSSVITRSECMRNGQLGFCACPTNLVLLNPTDTMCSDRPTGCSTNGECNSVISNYVCVAGSCQCPTDKVLLKLTDTMCSDRPTDAATTVVLSAMVLIVCLIASVV